MFDKDFVNILTIVAGVCATVYAYHISKKMDGITNRLNTSIDKVSNNIEVKADDAIIEEATYKAVNREVSKSATAIVRRVSDDFERTIRDEGKKEFDRCYDDMSRKILVRIDELVRDIDADDVIETAVDTLVDRLEYTVESQAKDKLVEKAEPALTSYAEDTVKLMKAVKLLSKFTNGVDLSL